jgi:uncharacterized membrane protein YraQ (UPF0718 family)
MSGFGDVDALFSFGPYRVAVIAYSMFLRLWYFLAIGIVIGAAFNVFLPADRIKRMVLKADSLPALIVSALVGAISPLGSYAIIPVFTVFLSMGIPLATVMTFLTAAPMINPYMFYITWQFLGLEMALARTVSAIMAGLLTGLFFKWLTRYACFQNNMNSSASVQPTLLQSERAGEMVEQSMTAFVRSEDKESIPVWKQFMTQCFNMTRYPAKWFLFSIVLAAVVDVYVPSDWIVRSLGGHVYSLLLSVAMAIPFYVCGGGAVPLIFEFMRAGMDQGAALTFFIAGPVTRIAPMVTVIALVRYKAFMVYLMVSMLCAVAFGYLYHFL